MLRQHFLRLKTTNFLSTQRKANGTNAPLFGRCVLFRFPVFSREKGRNERTFFISKKAHSF